MEEYAPKIPIYLILLFTAITFLQSGLDKIFDWSGNLNWLTGHFKGSFLGRMVPMLLVIILILGVLSGILALYGIFMLWLYAQAETALWALVLAGVTLLMLLFGQRIAKDYAGAFTICGYFLVVILGIYMVSRVS